MQNYWGFTPLEGGLAFLPSTVLVACLLPFSGIIGQRLGHRLRFLVMFASVCVAISFLYLLTLDTSDRYVAGFLPSFILRGIGIGLFMSATSLAVVSAVPLAKSGLASGTLTMSRNIGTSLGVAILGAMYLHYVHDQAPRRFSDASAGQLPGLTAGAARQVPSADPAFHAASSQLIVDGYVLVAIGCLVMALIATFAASFIRYAAPSAAPVPKT